MCDLIEPFSKDAGVPYDPHDDAVQYLVGIVGKIDPCPETTLLFATADCQPLNNPTTEGE